MERKKWGIIKIISYSAWTASDVITIHIFFNDLCINQHLSLVNFDFFIYFSFLFYIYNFTIDRLEEIVGDCSDDDG